MIKKPKKIQQPNKKNQKKKRLKNKIKK
jgi:hypothetical protein